MQLTLVLLGYNTNRAAQFLKSIEKGPKMDLPCFKGDNPLGWIRQVNSYFELAQAPDECKVDLAQAPIVVVTIIISSCIVIIYRKKRMQAYPHLQHVNEHINKRSYEDVVRATDRFSSANLIGSGSFGKVYKGSLQFQEDQVVIKIFDLDIYGAHRSFIAECEALRIVRHRNLVKVITSCSSVDYTGADFKALVFPYMPNGNLGIWLHPDDHEHGERNVLSLSQMINIALDVAFALDYLHSQCASLVIHCDLKPSNILLGLDMVAYVIDFGLARFEFSTSNAHQDISASSGRLKGSIGYIPPGAISLFSHDISSVYRVVQIMIIL